MEKGVKESKIVCLVCQDYADHVTSKCPFVKCKSCGVLGHTIKACPGSDPGPMTTIPNEPAAHPTIEGKNLKS